LWLGIFTASLPYLLRILASCGVGEYGCLDRLSCEPVDEWRRMGGEPTGVADLEAKEAVDDEGT
jgi:hypothetical protein